jgi:hypothetical protein
MSGCRSLADEEVSFPPSKPAQILVRSKAPPLTLLHAVGAQVVALNPEQQIYSNVEDLDSYSPIPLAAIGGVL